MRLPKIILNALTTADNGALDVIRCGMVVTGAAMIGLTAWAVIVNREPFNALDFGGGGLGLASKFLEQNSCIVQAGALDDQVFGVNNENTV